MLKSNSFPTRRSPFAVGTCDNHLTSDRESNVKGFEMRPPSSLSSAEYFPMEVGVYVIPKIPSPKSETCP